MNECINPEIPVEIRKLIVEYIIESKSNNSDLSSLIKIGYFGYLIAKKENELCQIPDSK